MKKVLLWIRHEAVLCIAFACALVSAVLVPPDGEYWGYMDFRVLGILFSLMAVVALLQEHGAFRALAARLHRAYLEECVDRTYPVLFEQPVAGRYGGHAPNYMEVAVSGGEDLHNRVLPVRITGTDGEILWGELE